MLGTQWAHGSGRELEFPYEKAGEGRRFFQGYKSRILVSLRVFTITSHYFCRVLGLHSKNNENRCHGAKLSSSGAQIGLRWRF